MDEKRNNNKQSQADFYVKIKQNKYTLKRDRTTGKTEEIYIINLT